MVPTVLGMHAYTAHLNRRKAAKLAQMVKDNGWTNEDVEREAARAAFQDLSDRENVFHRYMN